MGAAFDSAELVAGSRDHGYLTDRANRGCLQPVGLTPRRESRSHEYKKANTRLPCIVRWVGVIIDL